MKRHVKTAVSLPDDLFDRADALAERLGISRSELYARALARFVDESRDSSITQRLNDVYEGVDSTLDPILAGLQTLSLPEDEW